MQTALISGSSVPDRAPAGRQPSPGGGEGFAQHFELAGQQALAVDDRVGNEEPPGTFAEDTDADAPVDGEPENRQIPDNEAGLPANVPDVGIGERPAPVDGDHLEKSKGSPTFERAHATGRHSPGLESPAGAKDRTPTPKERDTGQLSGRFPSSGATATLTDMPGSKDQDKALTSGNVKNSAMTPGGYTQAGIRGSISGSLPGEINPPSAGKPGIQEQPTGLENIAKQPLNPGASDILRLGGTPVAADNPRENPRRYSLSPATDLPVETAVTVPEKQSANGVVRSGRSNGGMVDTATLQALKQGTLDLEFEPADGSLTLLPKTGAHPVSGLSTEAMAARPEMARHVAVQMADALINTQNNKAVITLNPEELGRVRMVLSTTETGVTISIIAERPETLDMMRRHIDQLAEEFRKLGYADIGFEFAEGDARRQFDKDGTDSPRGHLTQTDSAPDLPESTPFPPARATSPRGLDLRL